MTGHPPYVSWKYDHVECDCLRYDVLSTSLCVWSAPPTSRSGVLSTGPGSGGSTSVERTFKDDMLTLVTWAHRLASILHIAQSTAFDSMTVSILIRAL